MEMDFITTGMIIFVASMAGLAGFIDSIAGGGGLITLPAYLLTGMPAHNAYAVNKFAAVSGSITAMANYFNGKAIDVKASIIAAIGSAIGSAIAAQVVLILSDKALRLLVMIAIPLVAFIVITHKAKSDENRAPKEMTIKKALLAFFIGFIIGTYDGFIGPGTGTFAIISFAAIMKYDLLTAGGNAKVVNVSSNIASLITFLFNGLVIFQIAIPCAITTIIGAQIGSKMALNRGAKFIKPMMIVVVALMMIKMVYDFIVG